MDLADAKRLKELGKEDASQIPAEKSRAGTSHRKKTVSPILQELAVAHVVSHGPCSVRRTSLPGCASINPSVSGKTTCTKTDPFT